MKGVDLSVQLGPVTFANPIFTASGTWGYGLDFVDLVDPAALGAVVTKTLTAVPRRGNPQPRVRELRHGLLNSIGLENVGLQAFLREKLPALRERGVRTILSLAARESGEFATMVAELTRHEGWQGVELNLSCPNVAEGGLDFGRDPFRIREIVDSVRQVLPADRALLVKLTPNVTSIADLAVAAQDAGAHAISCINTVVGLEVDLETRRPVFPRAFAGYSGPAILPIALAKVWEVARAVDLPIVGIGGISSVEDVLRFLVVGAGAVQVGTALFARPTLAHDLVKELEESLITRGCASPMQMRCEELGRS